MRKADDDTPIMSLSLTLELGLASHKKGKGISHRNICKHMYVQIFIKLELLFYSYIKLELLFYSYINSYMNMMKL